MTGGRTPVRDIPGTFEVANVNEKIAPRLVGLQVTQQKEIDKLMVEMIDGAEND
jgi:enolase